MLNIDDRLIREVSPKIGPNALSVLLAISIHMDTKTDRCFPSHNTLMKLTGMGKNAVYAALNVLKEAGLLETYQKIDSEKRQFGRRYFRINTDFIGIFVPAKHVEPLPYFREPGFREPGFREPGFRETYQINQEELINHIELINQARETRARKIEIIETEPIEAETVVASSRPAQRVPPAPPVPAAPPAPAYNPPDSNKEAEALLADEICRERFFKQCRIPLDKYDSYVRLFALKVKSEQKRHSNRTDYRSHFFNWATVEYAREQNQPGNGNRKMVFDSPDTIREGLEFAERFAAEYRARQNRT